MWDEYITLRQNNFQFVKKYEDAFFKIINTGEEIPVIENVLRWFNNGFFITRDEHFERCESRDGVDLSYTEYYFKIYNNELQKIFSETSRHSNQFDYLTDFIGDYLEIKGGVINKSGVEIIPFKYSREEAKHRLLLKVPLEESSTLNIVLNGGSLIGYEQRKKNFENIDYTYKFISYLKKEIHEINEIIYHFLLRRYSYHMQETFIFKKNDDEIKYSDKEYILAKYDLTYMISEIKKILGINESLTINYWDKYNTHYSHEEIEFDLKNYFNESDYKNIRKRKIKLDEIIATLNLKDFSFEKFSQIATQKELLYKGSTPFVKGRKVYIQEFQTFESNFKKKTDKLQKIPCIYINEAEFLDKNSFANFHLVQDVFDLTKFYIVEKDFIKNNLSIYTYNDYLELLNLKEY